MHTKSKEKQGKDRKARLTCFSQRLEQGAMPAAKKETAQKEKKVGYQA